MAIPKEGCFTLEKGRYGPDLSQNAGVSRFFDRRKVKPGKEQAMRDYGKGIQVQSDDLSGFLFKLRIIAGHCRRASS